MFALTSTSAYVYTCLAISLRVHPNAYVSMLASMFPCLPVAFASMYASLCLHVHLCFYVSAPASTCPSLHLRLVFQVYKSASSSAFPPLCQLPCIYFSTSELTCPPLSLHVWLQGYVSASNLTCQPLSLRVSLQVYVSTFKSTYEPLILRVSFFKSTCPIFSLRVSHNLMLRLIFKPKCPILGLRFSL